MDKMSAPVGLTVAQKGEMYDDIAAGTREAMADTDALVQRDFSRGLEQLEFNHRMDQQVRLSAREFNESLAADIRENVKAPQIQFEPEMDAVARAEYAARGGTIDFMTAQTQAIANGAEVGHEPFRGAGASGSWAHGGASGSWDEPMSGYDKFSMTAHAGLGVAGAVPVLGLIPDAVDFLYTAGEMPFGKSSGLDLSLAGVGLVATLAPIGGDQAAAAMKIAARAESAAAKAVDEITSLNQLRPEHFATNYGEAVFYAGRGGNNRLAAEAAGGVTISQTVGGKALVLWTGHHSALKSRDKLLLHSLAGLLNRRRDQCGHGRVAHLQTVCSSLLSVRHFWQIRT